MLITPQTVREASVREVDKTPPLPSKKLNKRNKKPIAGEFFGGAHYRRGCAGVAGEEEEQCAVCRMEFDAGECVQCLPACGHVYHEDCLAPWLAENKCCPICKTEITAPASAAATATATP